MACLPVRNRDGGPFLDLNEVGQQLLCVIVNASAGLNCATVNRGMAEPLRLAAQLAVSKLPPLWRVELGWKDVRARRVV